MRPGLDNRFLRVGPSSGPRLPREVRAGWHHIGGQDVRPTFIVVRSTLLYFELRFKLSLCVELCHLYSKPLCKTRVVN